ncbi:hypothetical protein JJJA_0086 [Achromobacter phage JWDelta]|uniref:Uncharacterized protein n=2 Tax=Jwalphavirus jwalpha TaxID=2169963 RepID=V9VD01_9CAUD|nr:hypothetical protein CH29_gp89 [Achromobacter phage JWAlpha]AHC56602.1 hypothetical protein JJJA_0086 [Achromobacter phage JWDelta]AHC94042.1 hypothetical protein JJJB_0089 [Achromobacter phage JWAlpha]
MTLHVFDVTFNNAHDRGNVLDFPAKQYGRILVPQPYQDEVFGYVLLMDLPGNWQRASWYHGMICLDGWLVVIDPKKDTFIYDRITMPRLEPKEKENVRYGRRVIA